MIQDILCQKQILLY